LLGACNEDDKVVDFADAVSLGADCVNLNVVFLAFLDWLVEAAAASTQGTVASSAASTTVASVPPAVAAASTTVATTVATVSSAAVTAAVTSSESTHFLPLSLFIYSPKNGRNAMQSTRCKDIINNPLSVESNQITVLLARSHE
jgi:hypothetical protein